MDKLVEVVLISSHVSDFIWQREDGSHYMDCRGRGDPYKHEISINSTGTPKWIMGEKIE